MIVIQLLENLFHDSLTEEDCLCAYAKLVAILLNGRHLAVIQVYNLTMTTHKRRLLLFKIFGIYPSGNLLFSCHNRKD